MKGRDILKGLTEAKRSKAKPAAVHEPRSSGSVRSLETELDRIADQAATGKALQESIAKEGRLVELDPVLVDGAAISDRISLESDPQFEELKTTIRESGQQVPILVRVHPDDKSKFQAAYGHRRLKAARELGVAVKAIVRDLDDHQMIIAQGQENGSRVDLSFIERAFYASKLLANGHDRDVVCLALGVDKPEVSRLLQVAEAVVPELVAAIGPAPKIGRPRWIVMAKALENESFSRKCMKIILSDAFDNIQDSNERFELVLQSASKKKKRAMESKTKIVDNKKRTLGWIADTPKGVTITVKNTGLSAFLKKRLPELLEEFEQSSHFEK